MKKGQLCTKCGKHHANHTIHKWWEIPKEIYLCCKCYVEQGNSPSDWHPLCISTYKKVKSRLDKTNNKVKL